MAIDPRLDHKKAVHAAFDLETGGLNPHEHAIVSVAVVLYDAEWNNLGTYYTVVNDQSKKQTLGGFKQHGISEQQTKFGTPIGEVMSDLKTLFEGKDITGHNVGFDLDFLAQRGLMVNEAVDTLSYARKYSTELGLKGSKRLTEVARQFKEAGSPLFAQVDFDKAHNAAFDAQLAMSVRREMERKLGTPLGFSQYVFDTTPISNPTPQVHQKIVQAGSAANRMATFSAPNTPKIKEIPFRSDAQTQWLPPARLAQINPANQMTVRDSSGRPIGANSQTLSPAPGKQNLFSRQMEAGNIRFTDYFGRAKASQEKTPIFHGQSEMVGSSAWNIREAVERLPGSAMTVRQSRSGPEFAVLNNSVKINEDGTVKMGNGAPEDQNIKHLKLGWQTDIMHLADRNTGQALPMISSPVGNRTTFGERVQHQGQLVYYHLTHGMEEGQQLFITPAEQRVMGMQEQDVRGRLPDGADVSRFAEPREWRGTRQNIGLPYGLQTNSKDWDWVRTTGQVGLQTTRQYGVESIEAKVRLARYVSEEGVKSVGTLKAASAGWAPAWRGIQAESGKTIIATNETNIKLESGFYQQALGGALHVKSQELGSLQAAVRHYGLQSLFRDGIVDWDTVDLESDRSVLRPAIQKVREEYTLPNGDIRLPVLATFGRAGMYQWKKGRVNQELYSRLQETDPNFAKQLDQESSHIRGNYQDILNAFGQMASGQGRGSGSIDLNQELAGQILSAAAAGTSETLTASDFVRGMESVRMLSKNGLSGTTYSWKTTFQGKEIDLALPSSRQLHYFGHLWQDDFSTAYDDPADAEKAMKRWRSVISQYSKSATELIAYAAGAKPKDKEYEATVRRYLSAVSEMAASDEFNKMSTSRFARRGGGGVAQGDKAVPLNVVAVGDDVLKRMFPDIAEDAASLAELKKFINTTDVSALVMRNPSITRFQMPFLKLQSVDNVSGMAVQGSSRGIFIHPELMSLFGGDFDADQLLYLVRGYIDRGRDKQLQYRSHTNMSPDDKNASPDSIDTIRKNMDQMSMSGGGLHEYEESLKKQKLRLKLGGGSISEYAKLVIDNIGKTGMIGFGDLQKQFAYQMDAGKQMGLAYNLWRKGSVLMAGEARDSMDQVFDAIYKKFQDKSQLSSGMQAFWNFTTRLQPATGGLRPDFKGEMGRMGKGAVDLNTAMLQAIHGLLSSKEIADKHLLIPLLTDDVAGQERLRELIKDPNRLKVELSSIVGATPWDDAGKNGFMTLLRSEVSSRWDGEKAPMSDLDQVWKEMGKRLKSVVNFRSSKLAPKLSKDEVAPWLTNQDGLSLDDLVAASMDDSPENRTRIATQMDNNGLLDKMRWIFNKQEGVKSQAVGLMKSLYTGARPDIMGALRKIGEELNIRIPFTNPALGRREASVPAMIMEEEAALLGDLENIGRENPAQMRAIVGAISQSGRNSFRGRGNEGRYHFTNTAIPMPPTDPNEAANQNANAPAPYQSAASRMASGPQPIVQPAQSVTAAANNHQADPAQAQILRTNAEILHKTSITWDPGVQYVRWAKQAYQQLVETGDYDRSIIGQPDKGGLVIQPDNQIIKTLETLKRGIEGGLTKRSKGSLRNAVNQMQYVLAIARNKYHGQIDDAGPESAGWKAFTGMRDALKETGGTSAISLQDGKWSSASPSMEARDSAAAFRSEGEDMEYSLIGASGDNKLSKQQARELRKLDSLGSRRSRERRINTLSAKFENQTNAITDRKDFSEEELVEMEQQGLINMSPEHAYAAATNQVNTETKAKRDAIMGAGQSNQPRRFSPELEESIKNEVEWRKKSSAAIKAATEIQDSATQAMRLKDTSQTQAGVTRLRNINAQREVLEGKGAARTPIEERQLQDLGLQAEQTTAELENQMPRQPKAQPGIKNWVSNFMKTGQFQPMMQAFYYANIGKMADAPIQAAMQGAQTEMKYRDTLSQAGVGSSGGMSGSSIDAFSAYARMQSNYQRQAAATWSPLISGISGSLNGAGGFWGSVLPVMGAAAMSGGIIGAQVGTLFGPEGTGPGAVAGAGIAAGGALVTGAISHQQYLANNPAYAATDAYSNYVSGGKYTSLDGFGQTTRTMTSQELEGYKYWQMSNQGATPAQMKDLNLAQQNEVLNNLINGPTGLSQMFGITSDSAQQAYISATRSGVSINNNGDYAGAIKAQQMGFDLLGLSQQTAQLTGKRVDESGSFWDKAIMRGTPSNELQAMAGFQGTGYAQAMMSQNFSPDRVEGFRSGYENMDNASKKALDKTASSLDGLLALAKTSGYVVRFSDKTLSDMATMNEPQKQSLMASMSSSLSGQQIAQSALQGAGYSAGDFGMSEQSFNQQFTGSVGVTRGQRYSALTSKLQQAKAQGRDVGYSQSDIESIARDPERFNRAMLAGQNQDRAVGALNNVGMIASDVGFSKQQLGQIFSDDSGGMLRTKLFTGLGSNSTATSIAASMMVDTGTMSSSRVQGVITNDPVSGMPVNSRSFGIRSLQGGWMKGASPLEMMGQSFSATHGGASPMANAQGALANYFGGRQGWSVVGAGANADFMYTSPVSQMQFGGLTGLQLEASDLGFESTMASAGASIANINRDIKFTTGAGLKGDMSKYAGGMTPWGSQSIGQLISQNDIQDAQTKYQRGLQLQQVGLQGQSQALGHQQFLENWNLQREQTNLQYGWQVQDFGFQKKQMNMQRAFTTQDFAWKSADQDRQFGYNQEDYNFNIRYATGRERVQMERQEKRTVTEHNIEGDRLKTQESRQKQMWKLEDDRFKVEQDRAKVTYDLTIKRQDLDLEHEKERFDLEQGQFKLQIEAMQKNWEFENESLELQRKKYDEDTTAQKAQAGTQAGYAKMQKDNSDKQFELINNQQAKEALGMVDLFVNYNAFVTAFAGTLKDWSEGKYTALLGYAQKSHMSNPGDPGSVPGQIVTVPASGGGGAGGLTRLVTKPTYFLAGENGTESIHIQPFVSPYTTNGRSGGSASGTTTVQVFLDGNEISGHMVTKIADQINTGRRR